MAKMALIEVRDLRTYFFTEQGQVKAVDGVSYHVENGEVIALVGESGCGKTVSILSILRLLPRAARTLSGEVLFQGVDLLKFSEKQMRCVRGNQIAMVFQEPSMSFDPLFTVGYQIKEAIRQHRKANYQEASRRTSKLLEMVKIPDAAQRTGAYPFELSGGMLQRIMIAIAMSCEPKVLIADEPTTNLDATIQLQVLELMMDLVKKSGVAMILITHNMGLVARYVDRVYVFYAGKIVEACSRDDIFLNPLHPYTQGLLTTVPSLKRSRTERLLPIEGHVPNLVSLPPGCYFSPRCKDSISRCFQDLPPLIAVNPSHSVACHKYSGV